jgi:hypothetical protein
MLTSIFTWARGVRPSARGWQGRALSSRALRRPSPARRAPCPHPASAPSSPPHKPSWCPAGSCATPPSAPSRREGEGRDRRRRLSPACSTRVRCQRPARSQRPSRCPSSSCAAPPAASGRYGGEGRDLRQTTLLGIYFPSLDLSTCTKTTNSESDTSCEHGRLICCSILL